MDKAELLNDWDDWKKQFPIKDWSEWWYKRSNHISVLPEETRKEVADVVLLDVLCPTS